MDLRSGAGGHRGAALVALSRYLQPALVALAVTTGVIATAGFAKHVLGVVFFPDFTVFWTAARSPTPYDAVALTSAQQWALDPGAGLRPFAYPPSALLLLKPLSLLPYWPALIAWTVLGIAAFAAAAAAYGRKAILAVFSPMLGLSIIIGQLSLFLGAGLSGAVALVSRREVSAGILFGVVAAIKPQMAVLVPVALLAGSHWRGLAAAAATASLIVAASLLLGSSLWIDWIASLSGFSNQVLAAAFREMNLAPGLWFAPLGAGAVWYVWRTTLEPELRLVALVAGTCLCVPYIMNYDLVAMAPAASVLMLRKDWRGWIIGFFALAVIWLSPFVIAIGAVLLCLPLRNKNHPVTALAALALRRSG